MLSDGLVATGGDDRRIRIWDPASPGVERIALGGRADRALSVGLLPDGRVFSGGADG